MRVEVSVLCLAILTATGLSAQQADDAEMRRAIRSRGFGAALAVPKEGIVRGTASVAFRLPEEEAIRAVTINAAEFLGLDDRIGSLEPGKHATSLITTGTPINMTIDIEQAYIQGRELDMNDIRKHFVEKYMRKLGQMLQTVM